MNLLWKLNSCAEYIEHSAPEKMFGSHHARVIQTLDNVLTELNDFDVLSLDFFDTIFRRLIWSPDRIKSVAAIASAVLFDEYDIRCGADEWVTYRDRAERLARLGNQQFKGLDYECELRHVFSTCLTDMQVAADHVPAIVDKLIEIEIETEIAHGEVSRDVQAFLTKARESQCAIVLVSDFYLSARDFYTLVDGLMLGSFFDEICVSADYCLSKASGRLFTKCFSNFRDNWGGRILHVGDSYLSDFVNAIHAGASARLLDRRKERVQQERLDFMIEERSDKIRFGSSPRCLARAQDRRAAEVFANRVAPAIIIHVYKVLLSCRDHGIPRLLFVSREGYFLLAIAEEIKRICGGAKSLRFPELGVLPVSRTVVRPGYWPREDCLRRSILLVQQECGFVSFNEWIAFWGVDVMKHPRPAVGVRRAVSELGRLNDVTFNKPSMVEVLLKARPEVADWVEQDVRRRGIIFCETFGAYLGSGEDVCLYDVGWSGNVPNAIAHMRKWAFPGASTHSALAFSTAETNSVLRIVDEQLCIMAPIIDRRESRFAADRLSIGLIERLLSDDTVGSSFSAEHKEGVIELERRSQVVSVDRVKFQSEIRNATRTLVASVVKWYDCGSMSQKRDIEREAVETLLRSDADVGEKLVRKMRSIGELTIDFGVNMDSTFRRLLPKRRYGVVSYLSWKRCQWRYGATLVAGNLGGLYQLREVAESFRSLKWVQRKAAKHLARRFRKALRLATSSAKG